jgi:UDP-N-acetylglucosamine acyltransferase
MFVTVWMGILEISTGKVTAANAGHEYPAVMRSNGGFELFKDKHGFIIGGMAGTHQFTHIGRHCMVGGMSKVRQDVPPYMLCDMVDGYLKAVGPNVVGLTRRGFAKDVIQALKEAYRFIYRDGLNRSQALERVENEIEPFDEIKELVAFYRNSQRGVA